MIYIYTDGACSGNQFKDQARKGGWAFIAIKNDQIILKGSGNNPNTTNNQMELTAFLESLKGLKFTFAIEHIDPSEIFTIYSDSAYIVNCFKEKWHEKWLKNNWKTSKNEPVKNKELWIEILKHWNDIMQDKIKISIEHVKAHELNKWNNLTDELATKEIEKV